MARKKKPQGSPKAKAITVISRFSKFMENKGISGLVKGNAWYSGATRLRAKTRGWDEPTMTILRVDRNSTGFQRGRWNINLSLDAFYATGDDGRYDSEKSAGLARSVGATLDREHFVVPELEMLQMSVIPPGLVWLNPENPTFTRACCLDIQYVSKGDLEFDALYGLLETLTNTYVPRIISLDQDGGLVITTPEMTRTPVLQLGGSKLIKHIVKREVN